MSTKLADEIKVLIADLKTAKESIKRTSEAQIADIEARIAALQAIQPTLTSSVDAALDILKREGVDL